MTLESFVSAAPAVRLPSPRSRGRGPARGAGIPAAFGAGLLAAVLAGAAGLARAQASQPVQAAPMAAQGGSAVATDANEAFYQRAAYCAAALEVDQLALVARARAGTTGLRPQLVDVTQLGFTFVGKAYLRGLRDPRATDMLKAARAEQKDWPAARHQKVAAECRAEAKAMFDDATSMEQWFARKKANQRVDKFLAAAPASAPN